MPEQTRNAAPQTAQSSYAVISQDSSIVIESDGMIDISVKNEAKLLTAPIEKSSFATYNKVETPLDIYVTIASMQGEAEQTKLMDSLNKLAAGTALVHVVTPTATYLNMNMDSYNYKRSSESGVTLLICELHLLEIREVTTGSTVSRGTKRASSAPKQKTGQTQTKKNQSLLRAANDGKKISLPGLGG